MKTMNSRLAVSIVMEAQKDETSSIPQTRFCTGRRKVDIRSDVTRRYR